MNVSRGIMAILALAVLASCGGYERDIGLRDLRTNRGTPEEFAIVPRKQLELPETLNQLPQPTPGAANRTDQTPLGDAVAALGGNPSRLTVASVSASDGALLSSAGRFGTQGNIREVLAEEDLEFRKRRSIFTWKLFKEDEYNNAYRRERLDAGEELLRFRRLGVPTPSAPPAAN
ncbi:DUF3035 domain-containing protein [Puniceibacterium sp. IMCC21224]|uniref:DUF3035 domain-containing protein n=1 Tax=Puniceibacterium sp. IMCC21224 TaxID=1618204 RepID=UPI00065CD6E8|nr:DUF3035 domain-containing protein [Puniceibacterium sp. IMCC21224]KMK68789.1 Beta-barrel assembly machine subunit BamF [Puniceibacterium sp. IMCC21224]